MARRLVSTVVRMRGGATLGFGARVRIYDDAALTTLSTIYRRATGVGTQPNPLLPNAGMQTALTVNGAAIDTTITVAATAGLQVGDLIPLRDGTNAVYRVITAINTGTGVITLDSALGFAFLASATTVGAREMRGHIWGWLETVLDPFAEIEDIASARRSPPLQIQVSLPASVVSIKDEGGALGQFSVLNFLGSAITVVDGGAGQLNVTVTGIFETANPSIQLGENGSVQGGLKIWNAVVSAEGNIFGDATYGIRMNTNSNASPIRIDGSALVVGSSSLSVGTIPAVAGTVRLPAAATISNRNAGNTADEQIWPHLTVEASLSGDVAIATPGTFVDGPSVSLPPGIWLITGTITCTAAAGTNAYCGVTAKLWDGTTVEASSEQGLYGNAVVVNAVVSISLSGIVNLAATTTMKISVTSTTAQTLKAAAVDSGAGNNASHIKAVRIG